MKKNLILLVFAFSLQCCGQEKETTYWEIEKIYRKDKKPPAPARIPSRGSTI